MEWYISLVWLAIISIGAYFIAKISNRTLSKFFIEFKKKTKLHPAIIDMVHLLIRYTIYVLLFVIVFLNLSAILGFGGLISQFVTQGLIQNIPSFMFLAFIIVAVWVAIRILNIFFADLKTKLPKQLTLVEMAHTVTKYLIYMVAAVLSSITILSAMGLREVAASLLTLFVLLLGVIVSMAAAAGIGNTVAGLILMNWKPYKTGDRILLGGGSIWGDVVEMDVMFTKVKTPNNELVYVPNLMVIGKEITNFSAYDNVLIPIRINISSRVNRKEVEGLLIKAALQTEGIMKKPAPTVFVNDISLVVAYELRAYTNQPNQFNVVKSELMKNILDALDEAKVELQPSELLNLPGGPAYIVSKQVT